MTVMIGHGSMDESGRATGGTAGDQTGREVCTREWYRHRKGWVVLRCGDREKRQRIAQAMEAACGNSRIGYDQNQRDSLFDNVKGSGFDPSKTTGKVETDCSALVRVCIAYAFGRDVSGNVTTATLPDTLVKTGYFQKLTDAEHCESQDRLLRGDILCTPVKGHTAVVLTDGENAVDPGVRICVPVLCRGERGGAVEAMQMLLAGRGFPCGSSGIDGSFGPATEKALKQYQKDRLLDADGKCGPKTWSSLLTG